MTLVVAVMASLAFALLTADFRWRPLALSTAFLLRVGVPSIAGDIEFSSSAIHVSTILIVAYAAVWPFATHRTEPLAPSRRPQIPPLCHVTLTIVAAGSVIMSDSLSAMTFVAGFVLNQLVAPYIFCVLIYNFAGQHQTLQKDAGRLFALLCVIESLIALAVNSHLIMQPYLSAYSTAASSIATGTLLTGTDLRQPATFDHPLALGLFLAAGIPMAAYFRSRITTYLAIFVMFAGISVTQSRIALAAGLFGVIFLFVIGSKKLLGRIALLIAAATGYVLLDATGVFEGVLGRIQDDQGSSQARVQAAQLFMENWTDFKVSGVGMDLGKAYFASHGLRSSGESAAICYAVGIGILLSLLYFGLILWMIARAIRQARTLSPASAAAIIVFVYIQFYSSISTESAAGMILWATIGIALATPWATSSPHNDLMTQKLSPEAEESQAI